MTTEHGRIPPGPEGRYSTNAGLLNWMADQFDQFGDIFQASIDGTSAYIIRNPRYAEHVLRDNWRNYVKGQAIKRVALLLGNGLMVSEGQFWKTQRRMIQPAFHREAIAGLINLIVSANRRLLEAWENAAQANRDVDVTADLSHMVLDIVLCSIFGNDYNEIEARFRVLSDEGGRSLEFAQTFRSLGRTVLEIAAKRREENRNATDLLGMLMEARDRDTGRPMPDRQLINEVMTLIVAGHETTASTLNWIWYLLSQHPEIDEKLSLELDTQCADEFSDITRLSRFTYTRQVIDEALRLYPPGWLMTRKALKDDQLGEYFVPAGTEIYIPPYFIQRHPDLWNEPSRFDPDRFAAVDGEQRERLAMLPFSAGPRNCIGELMARVEMQVHLMIVARRLRLRYSDSQPPELDIGVNLRSKHHFIMTPEMKALAAC